MKRVTTTTTASTKPRIDHRLELTRKRAKKHLPRLGMLVEGAGDPDFIGFMQDVIDNYMLNVCKLDRTHRK